MLRSTGFRFLVVGTLTLFMFIPLFFVAVVIEERAEYSRDTIAEVGREWGGIQRLTGPQLVIPVEGPVTREERRETIDPETGEPRFELVDVTGIVRTDALHVWPETFSAQLSTRSRERERGIFRVPVYEARAGVDFAFDLSDLEAAVGPAETILWGEAELQIEVGDSRALRGDASLTSGGRRLALEPLAGGGIRAGTGDPRDLGAYRLDLGFNGAGALYVAPGGRTTDVTISGDWPHPSFDGVYLPDSMEVSESGFEAHWTIPHLARPLPLVSREDQMRAARAAAFGLRYYQPNDFYQKAYRAARYGILYIALTFLTVLLIEDRHRRPVHPVQYLLIGLVQSVFVLLMVAYAEQIGFAPAYFLSAGAVTTLLTGYGWAALKLGRRTWALGGLLAALYAVLFLILRSADYALLAGATLAFGALAATMWLTRNEDWYGAPGEGLWRRKAPLPAAPVAPPGAG
ncbi:cell envelope integrity protein CreD [Roseisalinus antarcticus]|uniref:Inner membrane protein CreD n=1 Tax=Roseisalinus antarcticus TaxID=254357 RepID=A0A1Y5RR18_9RHOB|nr:cell envelope integrity protein CreD [Roseisalinus antarcticus]SLN23347.1 Inner membrane protein CreD [Roseisalinus antarcticus]